MGRRARRWLHRLPGQHRGEARDPSDRAQRRHDGQGQPPPLHAQGNPRAAGGHRRHAAQLHRSRDAHGQPAGAAVRLEQGEPHHHHGLRRRLLCLHGCQILVRADRAPAGRGRTRLRVSLSRAAAAGRRRVHRGVPVGRDGRHPGCGALRQVAEANHPLGRERAGERDRPRVTCRAAYPGRSRDQRLLDQGHDHAADRPAGHRDRRGPRPGHAVGCR